MRLFVRTSFDARALLFARLVFAIVGARARVSSFCFVSPPPSARKLIMHTVERIYLYARARPTIHLIRCYERRRWRRAKNSARRVDGEHKRHKSRARAPRTLAIVSSIHTTIVCTRERDWCRRAPDCARSSGDVDVDFDGGGDVDGDGGGDYRRKLLVDTNSANKTRRLLNCKRPDLTRLHTASDRKLYRWSNADYARNNLATSSSSSIERLFSSLRVCFSRKLRAVGRKSTDRFVSGREIGTLSTMLVIVVDRLSCTTVASHKLFLWRSAARLPTVESLNLPARSTTRALTFCTSSPTRRVWACRRSAAARSFIIAPLNDANDDGEGRKFSSFCEYSNTRALHRFAVAVVVVNLLATFRGIVCRHPSVGGR